MVIERCYGQMKRRFPILSNGLRFRKPKDSANCIIAIAVLFNICKRNQDGEIECIDIQIENDEEIFDYVNQNSLEKRNEIARLL